MQDEITFIVVDSVFQGRRLHVVREGENLLGIAARYKTTVAAIARANSIPNPDLVGIGQKIVIPEIDEAGSSEAADAEGHATDVSNAVDVGSARDVGAMIAVGSALEDNVHMGIHVVRNGETLRDIAELYGSDIWALAKVNGLQDIDMISGPASDDPSGLGKS